MSIGPLDFAPVVGVPVWLYITFGFILFFIAVNLYWVLRISKLGPVKGWGESLKKMTQNDVQVWFISRVQKLTIDCMTIKDNVLTSHDPANIGMWHVNTSQGIIQVGGCKAVVVSEDFDQNRDFVTEIALCHVCDEFNANQEQLKADVDKAYQEKLADAKELGLSEDFIDSIKPQVVKPIENCDAYEMYGRKCLQATHPDFLEIHPYNIYNPNRFRKYFPRGCSSMFFGGELIHDARKLNLRRKPKGFWEVHAFLMVAAGISMIALLVAWLFPMGA